MFSSCRGALISYVRPLPPITTKFKYISPLVRSSSQGNPFGRKVVFLWCNVPFSNIRRILNDIPFPILAYSTLISMPDNNLDLCLFLVFTSGSNTLTASAERGLFLSALNQNVHSRALVRSPTGYYTRTSPLLDRWFVSAVQLGSTFRLLHPRRAPSSATRLQAPGNVSGYILQFFTTENSMFSITWDLSKPVNAIINENFNRTNTTVEYCSLPVPFPLPLRIFTKTKHLNEKVS